MKLYDTNALLFLLEDAFEENFLVSSITLKELENIKTAYNKDSEIKYKCRKLAKLLLEYEDKYEVLPYSLEEEDLLTTKFKDVLDNNADSKIIVTAFNYSYHMREIEFVTMDMCAYHMAKCLLKAYPNEEFTIEYPKVKEEKYTGFKTFFGTPDELTDFYQNLSSGENHYDMLINEYMIIFDKNTNEALDYWKWAEGGFVQVPYTTAESRLFGKTKPLDAYQRCAMDSMKNNQFTVLRGKAGTGKSLLAMSFLIQQLEKGKIDKIIIFCNNVATKDSAKLGFYPGSKDEKLLDSQIGNFLTSKFGDITQVERMIDDGTLLLVPTADCRGMDTTGMRAGVYFTEAQNSTVDMMKLMIQRVGEDSIVIFEGDDRTQVDMNSYAENNGLKRLSEVFRGEDYYGEVTLMECHRSKMAARAELM